MTVTAWTKQGRVAGERVRGPVCVFRGIPYARPPAGQQRFRAPEPPEAWQGTRDALQFGPAAPQDPGLATDIGERDEDCLYLNVWTPAPDAGARPVLVWIHGGGFTIGSSAQALYDATELAARGGVVVVTLNYRLGVLGFGFLREVLGRDLPANVALLDQIAALEWVRDNIAEFGGDPTHVTVFGESAGGMSVSTLLATPRAEGLFRRAIAQSGAAHHVLSSDEASKVAEVFLREIGAGAGSPERVWSASVDEVVAAQRACMKLFVMRGPRGRQLRQGAFAFMPVVDGGVLPDDPLARIRAGAAREVALLTGANTHEWNYFLFLTEPDKRDIDDAALLRILEKRLPGHGRAAIEFYRQQLGAAAPSWSIYAAIESDRVFRMPMLRLAEAHAAHARSTFCYLFDFRSPLFHGQLGACHALEVPFVFGTLSSNFGRALTGATEDAVRLSNQMIDAWVAFARGGEPGHEQLGAWPRFDVDTRATMVLGLRTGVESGPIDAFRPFWEDLV